MTLTVLVCGGGNGSQALSAIAASRKNIECRVLTLTQAERWNKALENKVLSCCFPKKDGQEIVYNASPRIISNNPARVVRGADVIILSIPAYSHQKYLKVIEPHITTPTIIVGLPGQLGFEMQISAILGAKKSLLTVLSGETFPWACRITKFGVNVQVIGIKTLMKVALVRRSAEALAYPLQLLQYIVGERPLLQEAKHYLELSPMFSAMHVALLYGKWKNWDGQPLQNKPVFYRGVDCVQCHYVCKVKDEFDLLVTTIDHQRKSINLGGWEAGFKWFIRAYGSAIRDKSSLQMALATNEAYIGLEHPMKEVEGGYIPDFSMRYLSEDVPYTLVVMKGIAELVGLETPVLDTLIKWGQEKLEKEYIIGCQLKGNNVDETRAPQVYGISSLEDLENFDRNFM